MGPVESNPDRYAGAWRLLIWAPLLVLAVASRFVLPSSWAGLVALWGWAPLLVDLAAAGVWIDPNRQNESYGRFAWIKDCDGNRVELWQPLEAPET